MIFEDRVMVFEEITRMGENIISLFVRFIVSAVSNIHQQLVQITINIGMNARER